MENMFGRSLGQASRATQAAKLSAAETRNRGYPLRLLVCSQLPREQSTSRRTVSRSLWYPRLEPPLSTRPAKTTP